jgi:ribulose-5-phosphate 4-epimerase/fuculose-1-phosphate aldolase
VKLAVTRTELELLKEHGVVVRGERVEDIKLGLS